MLGLPSAMRISATSSTDTLPSAARVSLWLPRTRAPIRGQHVVNSKFTESFIGSWLPDQLRLLPGILDRPAATIHVQQLFAKPGHAVLLEATKGGSNGLLRTAR